MILIILFNLFLGASCIFAIARGGAPERIAALLYCSAALVTYLLPYDQAAAFRGVETTFLMIDLALAAALIALTARADRYWTIWAAALQLVIVTVHLAKAYSPSILPVVYFAVTARLAYVMLALLVVATIRHRQRKARFGSDDDWSPPPPRATARDGPVQGM